MCENVLPQADAEDINYAEEQDVQYDENEGASVEVSANNVTTIADVDIQAMTPAMAQYIEIKKEHPDYLLFYRMGDFYEIFFEDAITASGALGLTLTSRNKNGGKGKSIPMCGVPFHAYEVYLARLIKMGYKVAICEQMEDPKEAKKRGYKAVVRREVARLVTPGTLVEDTMLDAKRHNYLAAVYVRASEIGVAWLDISTGAFYLQNLKVDKIPPATMLSTALARLEPVELIVEDKLLGEPEYYSLFGEYKDRLSVLPKERFNYDSSRKTLLKAYNIQALEAIGDFSKSEIIVAGVLFEYIENTQKGLFPRVEHPRRIEGAGVMEIDTATRRSLEILSSNSKGGMSLLKTIDRTVTGAGGRLLSERLSAPIMDLKIINDRLDMVSFFVDNPQIRQKLRRYLRECLDMERALQRLSIGKGGPRELWDLGETLKRIPYLKNMVLSLQTFQRDSIYTEPPLALKKLVDGFSDHSALADNITQLLKDNRDDLPALARAGGFVKEGAYAPLDYLHNIRQEAENRCEKLKEEYAIETGVNTLKIKNNSVIGYYVEVPSKFADVLLTNNKFIHRQSVLNAVRFTTEELSKLEEEVNSANDKALAMEVQIFEEATLRVLAQSDMIVRSASIIAQLDVATAMAEIAVERGYVRPVLDESFDFEIEEGRHPVVEMALKKENGSSFVGNDCKLIEKQDNLWLLTGPNMAGKSTFLRQNALIAIMAQMGAFVPAKSARIGLINRIFSRVGASDDLARGRSTFMVEMVETAAILNRADERSFVILDEIGRGTATYDGLSIAWAVVEQLAEVNKCRTIFATHYHELTKLYKRLKTLSLHCMRIKEFNGDVVFLHEVIDGAADRSYGIHVAKLAGLPDLTIKRAEQVLQRLEDGKQHKAMLSIEDDLPLFESLKESIKPVEENPVVKELKMLNADDFSPREALDKMYELIRLAKEN